MNDPIRYSFGADEYLFTEVSESMSLEAFFEGMAVTLEQALEARRSYKKKLDCLSTLFPC